ncbi:WD40 repeat-like protein, partial [Auriscalpium vulgare]
PRSGGCAQHRRLSRASSLHPSYYHDLIASSRPLPSSPLSHNRTDLEPMAHNERRSRHITDNGLIHNGPASAESRPARVELKGAPASCSSRYATNLITLEVERCTGLPKMPKIYFPTGFCVFIRVDGNANQRTRVAAGKTDAVWTALESHVFNFSQTSRVQLEVWADQLPRMKCVAKGSFLATALLQAGNGPHSLDIIYPRGSAGLHCQLYITGTAISQSEEHLGVNAQVANLIAQPASTIHITGSTSATTVTPILQENTASTGDVWMQLLENINLVASLMDKVSEVHSYLSAAWTILDAGRKIIVAQQERTSRVEELGHIILSVYGIIDTTSDLKINKAQQQILCALSKQTLECGYFILDYYRERSKWQDAFKNILSKTNTVISKYEGQFSKLRDALQQHTSIELQVIVQGIFEKVEEIMENSALPDMPYYATGASYQTEKQCLDGTREELLSNIRAWIDNVDGYYDDSRVFLLTGLSGTGKSSVAHSIAKHYDELNRLGSSFFFNRNKLAICNSEHIFSNLAVDLAEFDRSFRGALVKCVGNKQSLRGAQDLQRQLENFILLPVKELTFVGPIVIVIDALDESGSVGSRYQFLKSFVAMLSALPRNFRILLTSRPEEDIVQTFLPSQHVYHQNMSNVLKESTNNDILTFIQSELRDARGIPYPIFQMHHYKILVAKAEGLFQWAYVACSVIKGSTPSGMFEEFTSLTSNTSRSDKGPLDDIYVYVLSTLVGSTNTSQKVKKVNALKALLGQVLATFQPLSADSLKEMHRMAPKSVWMEDFDWALSKLGALLTGVIDHSEPIEVIHTSFQDFLMNQSHSGEFYIEDTSYHHDLLVWGAIHTLNKVLKFNMCDFPSSYYANSDVYGLDVSVQFYFTLWSQYAIQYWGLHFAKSSLDAKLESCIMQFLETKLLFWLEALSLLKHVNSGIKTLSAIGECCKTERLKLYVQDVKRFVLMFGPAIVKSMPHIYLSSMAYAPQESLVHKMYAQHLQCLPRIAKGHIAYWPATIMKIHGGSMVWAVSYSPDGRHIVSGSYGMCIWDAHTGQPVGTSLEGHTGWVLSVAYSPDGQYIVSGGSDKSICIWDAHTCQPVGRPLEGHTGEVGSVAYSPDGQYIVSGSHDTTVCIWNAHTGQSVGTCLGGHTDCVTSVTFSPDGQHIVSGSYDKTIRIWDAHTGQPVGAPLEGHTDEVFSVAYSPDGLYIVSGSNDKTIRIWETQTGQPIGMPLEGHTGSVHIVTYSTGGQHIVSASWDTTVRIWDVHTGQPVGTPLEGHTNGVQSVACSPDGQHIVSGSRDTTIRIWDIHTGQPVSTPLEKHTENVQLVAYSPDGQHIVSGSYDKTIRMWDAHTGQPVGTPLEGHTRSVPSVAYSPDGQHIVSGSYDRSVRIWD